MVRARPDSKLSLLLNCLLVQVVDKLKAKFHVLWSKKVVAGLLEQLARTAFAFGLEEGTRRAVETAHAEMVGSLEKSVGAVKSQELHNDTLLLRSDKGSKIQ